MVLKPNKRSRRLGFIASYIALAIGLIFLGWSLFQQNLLGIGIFDAGVSFILIGLLGAFSLLEIKRNESIELSDHGISAMVWRLSPIPAFRIVCIGWENVKAIGQKGNVFLLDCGDVTIQVNPNLFDQPEAVIDYLSSKAQGASAN